MYVLWDSESMSGKSHFRVSRGPFLESPETFRDHFGWHNSLCIFKTKASRSTKLCSYFNFYSLHNIWKDQLNRISGSDFYEWLFGPEKFSGLSRNGHPGKVYNIIPSKNKWHLKKPSKNILRTFSSKVNEISHKSKKRNANVYFSLANSG